jgi:transcriptional regulator with XRE-family HTH domain
MSFPEHLKAQRERLGLTQAELASFLEVSPRAVWQWEQGTLPHVLTQEGAIARLSKAKQEPKSKCSQCNGSGWERIGDANLIRCRECDGTGKQRVRKGTND